MVFIFIQFYECSMFIHIWLNVLLVVLCLCVAVCCAGHSDG